MLLFGLFPEIAVEMVKQPNHIINTKGFDEAIIGLSGAFLLVSAVIQARHFIMLCRAALGHRSA